MFPINLNLENLSISLLWLFHISGVIGILYGNSDWFISATPINLTLNFILLIINCKGHKFFFLIIILSFFTGMIVEVLGVKFGWIFGDYKYGSKMGIKIFEVPVLIGINWALLTVITGAISQQFYSNFFLRIIIGVSLMLLLDLLMEPLAPVLDFWSFDGNVAPLKNYIGWSSIAFFLQFFYHYFRVFIKGWFPFHLYLLLLIFFSVLLIKHTTIGL